jgi:hypothetical protein
MPVDPVDVGGDVRAVSRPRLDACEIVCDRPFDRLEFAGRRVLEPAKAIAQHGELDQPLTAHRPPERQACTYHPAPAPSAVARKATQ